MSEMSAPNQFRTGRGGIPDRWLDYTNVGRQVPGTPFIAFKVPLKQSICTNLWKSEKRFSPLDLLETVPKIGLVIDLTNTARYYDYKDILRKKVSYKKINVMGHQVPNKKVVRRFFRAVTKFTEAPENKEMLVGVHCTHGVNRTGYMLCRYMITKLGFVPDQAIEEVGKARGYEIERENYLNDLRLSSNDEFNEPDGKESDSEEEYNFQAKSVNAEHQEKARTRETFNRGMKQRSQMWNNKQNEHEPDSYPRITRGRSPIRRERDPMWRGTHKRFSDETNERTLDTGFWDHRTNAWNGNRQGWNNKGNTSISSQQGQSDWRGGQHPSPVNQGYDRRNPPDWQNELRNPPDWWNEHQNPRGWQSIRRRNPADRQYERWTPANQQCERRNPASWKQERQTPANWNRNEYTSGNWSQNELQSAGWSRHSSYGKPQNRGRVNSDQYKWVMK